MALTLPKALTLSKALTLPKALTLSSSPTLHLLIHCLNIDMFLPWRKLLL
jgi:hypothetical protein